MASLDYTNIAGSEFPSYVDAQIERRKALVNNNFRSSSELLWLSNKNAWIKISSGVNVNSTNLNYQGLTGEELSKKYILQGGVISSPNELREGISFDGAYGIGGTDFGLVPMPGLTDISIKTGGKLGTLKEITFNFVCHNLEQLNIMEALYMKLGFGVLVEWGHTIYIDNATGNISSRITTLPFYDLKTKEDVLQSITIFKKGFSGNYDASWGTVKNFSYALDENGKFKCQVQLVGAGDILESLKINISGQKENQPITAAGSIYPVIADANLSLLNEALYNIYNISGDATINFVVDSNYISSMQPYFNNIGLDVVNWDNNNELIKKGFNYRLINDPNLGDSDSGYKDTNVPPIYYPTAFFSRLVADYDVPEEINTGQNISDATQPGMPQVYITLGHLLLLIMSTGMIYQRNEGEGQSKQRPYIYVDVNTETNRCYTFRGHCSLDPGVCLIGSETLPFGIKTDNFDTLKNTFNWFDNNGTGGRFMWTLVNVDFVASVMRKWRGNSVKGDVFFIDLIKDILDGISKATGGYNEFRVVPDDDSRCIRILDDRRMAGIPVPDYTEIPILGKNSIVYNFDYTSKIAPNTAAMIVVAAQAQPYGVQGAENALAFSHLNKGLYNRLDTIVVDSGTENNQQQTSSPVLRYVELRDYIEFLYSGEGTGFSAAFTEEEEEELIEEIPGTEVKEEEKPKTFAEEIKSWYTEGGKRIKFNGDRMKEILKYYIIFEYEAMRKIVTDEKLEISRNEMKNLDTAKNKAIQITDSSKLEDLDLPGGEEIKSGQNYSTNVTSFIELAHDLMGGAYSDIFGFGDRIFPTDIEKRWEEYAKESANTLFRIKFGYNP